MDLNSLSCLKKPTFICALLLITGTIPAYAAIVDSVKLDVAADKTTTISINLSEPLESEPRSFLTETPPRLAIDLEGIFEMADNFSVNDGLVKDLQLVASGDRSRLIFDLKEMVSHKLTHSNREVLIQLTPSASKADKVQSTPKIAPKIENIDFNRVEVEKARITVELSQPDIPISVSTNENEIVVDFAGATLPERLNRKLKIAELGTPAKTVETSSYENGTVMVISGRGSFQHSAYQANNKFVVELFPKKQPTESETDNDTYSGERLSLNFQDIEVRAILQLLADFTNKNLVASDSVEGSITLRLKNVPWDQALDIILKARGLGKREVGNVMMVAPQEELTARERLELESQQQYLELSPLHTEFIQVNYAKASDMAAIIRNEANNLISERGNVTVDERTNTLLIQETKTYLTEIKKILIALDIPVRQVQIESKIVIANDDFSKDLGVKLGYSLSTNPGAVGGNPNIIIGGGIGGDAEVGAVTSFQNLTDTAISKENYQVSLPVAGPAGALRMMIGKQGSYLLNLELQAAQAEGRGDIISTPTVITANQREATIESGTEIPFLEAASSGATSVSFKKAVLSLKVTPQITPDDRIIMDLKVNKDSVGTIFSGIPSIDTNNLITQVLVQDGETVVLGGVYESTDTNSRRAVPVLGDIPVLGRLFRSNSRSEKKKELLVFITPRILDQGFSLSP